jgi:hypothetical protein
MNDKHLDGLLFLDENKRDEIIFNYATWREIIKAIIVKFSGKTYQEAENLVSNSPITNAPPENSSSVLFLSHDLEYHWAMLIAHGENYWLHGVNLEAPDCYLEWDRNYRLKNGLAEESFVWKNNGRDRVGRTK